MVRISRAARNVAKIQIFNLGACPAPLLMQDKLDSENMDEGFFQTA